MYEYQFNLVDSSVVCEKPLQSIQFGTFEKLPVFCER